MWRNSRVQEIARPCQILFLAIQLPCIQERSTLRIKMIGAEFGSPRGHTRPIVESAALSVESTQIVYPEKVIRV